MAWTGDLGSWRGGERDANPAEETDWDALRQELRRDALDQGLAPVVVERVVEGTIRRMQADEEGRSFYYGDIERELEQLYLSVGAAPRGIEKAKAKVWAAARANVAQCGGGFEESLFYCYLESLDMHREHLGAQQSRPLGRSAHRQPRSGGFLLVNDPTDGDFFGF